MFLSLINGERKKGEEQQSNQGTMISYAETKRYKPLIQLLGKALIREVSRHITIMCHKKTIFKRNTHLSLRVMCIWTSILYIFIAMHSCIHIALHVQEEAILVLNHLNDTVYEVFNISYHKVTDYLNTHNEIILNNIKD